MLLPNRLHSYRIKYNKQLCGTALAVVQIQILVPHRSFQTNIHIYKYLVLRNKYVFQFFVSGTFFGTYSASGNGFLRFCTLIPHRATKRRSDTRKEKHCFTLQDLEVKTATTFCWRKIPWRAGPRKVSVSSRGFPLLVHRPQRQPYQQLLKPVHRFRATQRTKQRETVDDQ